MSEKSSASRTANGSSKAEMTVIDYERGLDRLLGPSLSDGMQDQNGCHADLDRSLLRISGGGFGDVAR